MKGRGCKGGADKTPLGFLTWLVRNGHLRDCARALIKYGVKPALGSPTRASMHVFKQYFELHNDHDIRTDEKNPTQDFGVVQHNQWCDQNIECGKFG